MQLPTNNEDLVAFLMRHYDRTRDQLSDLREKWFEFYKLYHSHVDLQAYPLKFKVFIPMSFALIETLMPRYMHSLYYRDPLYQVKAAHPFTPPESVEAAGTLLNKWSRHPEQFLEYCTIQKEKMLYGQSYGKIYMRKKRAIVRRFTPAFSLPGGPTFRAPEKLTVNKINQPWLEAVDLFDVAPDLRQTRMSRTEIMCHKFCKSFDEFKYGEIEYENLKALEDMGDFNDEDDYAAARLGKTEKNYVDGTYYDMDHKPRMGHEFTVRVNTRDGEEIHLITLGNRKVILRHEIIPIWPWVQSTEIFIPHERMGMSQLASGMSLQMGINDLMNMQLENMLMSLTKMFIAGDMADVDLDTVVMEPLNVIQVSDISQFREMNMGGLDNAGQMLQQALASSWQTTTGMQDYFQGATPNRQEFATTVLSLQQAAETRIDGGVKYTDREFIAVTGEAKLELAQHHLDDPEFVETENGWMAYTYENLGGLMEVRAATSGAGMNEIKRKALTEYSSMLANLLGPALDMGTRIKLASQLSQTFDGLEEIKHALDATFKQMEEAEGAQQSAAGAGGQQAFPGQGISPNGGGPGGGEIQIDPSNLAALGLEPGKSIF